jgi:magnesium chelatase family protein
MPTMAQRSQARTFWQQELLPLSAIARSPRALGAFATQMPEILEVSMVASIAGLLHDGRLTERRPFRNPHHATSVAAMVGGGTHARPGEVSLAPQGRAVP